MTLLRVPIFAAIAIGIAIGLLGSQLLPPWREEPGPKLRRDCASLVDTVLNEDPSVPRRELEQELAKRGVIVPPFPSDSELGRIDPSQSDPVPAAAHKSEGAYRQYLQATERERLDRFLESERSGKYQAVMKAYDAKWDEIRRHPRYDEAWEVVLSEKRNRAIKDCILSRARREGVNVR